VVKSVAAPKPFAYVSRFTSCWTSHLFYQNFILPTVVVLIFQLAHPQTRFHLYLGPYSTLRDGFFVSYNFNPDSGIGVSSISS